MGLRKRWLLAPAVGLVAVGSILGGVAFAQSPSGDGKNPKDQVIEKAAGELGIDPSQLRDALKTARDRVMEERLNAKLDTLVADGTLTREEADQIKVWIAARPAALDKLGPGELGLGRHGHFGGPRFHRGGPRSFDGHMPHMPAPTQPSAPSEQGATGTSL